MRTLRTSLLEEMTWPDVAEAVEGGIRRVVFAVGAVDQHGPHLPLLVDAEIGTDLARRVARELDGTLVAPTMSPRLGQACQEAVVDLIVESYRDWCRERSDDDRPRTRT